MLACPSWSTLPFHRYEGRRSSDGKLAFRVRNTQVCVDMEPFKSTPIPAHHRKAFDSILVEA